MESNKCPRTLGQSFEALEERLERIEGMLEEILEHQETGVSELTGEIRGWAESPSGDLDEYGSIQ